MGNIENSTFYNEVLTDHNMHPIHKHELEHSTCELDGVNPSCGDEITLQLNVEDGIIRDGAFVGDGCAVSQASTDIMLELIIGKRVEEAKRLASLFFKMIQGAAAPEEIDELEEAGALEDISHMPARVKCAVLGWHTLEKALEEAE